MTATATTEFLRRDHAFLRKQLELLEAAMRMAPESQLVLREMCFLLSGMLQEHLRCEEEALPPYRRRLYALHQERLGRPYDTQRTLLAEVNALLLNGLRAPSGEVVGRLTRLIRGLREQMAAEEREVFPLVERLAVPAPPVRTIPRDMTVNHVLRIHPRAREIFRTFHIHCDVDGCHCLSELAWRRGTDVETLLLLLRAGWN